jgi:TM2 domain-containing membrane protein YozV
LEETRRSGVPAVVFSWLVPGAGHLYLRRPGKALLFFAALGTLFALGVAMDSRLEMTLTLDDLLASLFSLAQVAVGIPYFVARTLGFQGDVRSVTFEYGNTFTAVAGLLNILVMLDAYDTALGRKR